MNLNIDEQIDKFLLRPDNAHYVYEGRTRNEIVTIMHETGWLTDEQFAEYKNSVFGLGFENSFWGDCVINSGETQSENKEAKMDPVETMAFYQLNETVQNAIEYLEEQRVADSGSEIAIVSNWAKNLFRTKNSENKVLEALEDQSKNIKLLDSAAKGELRVKGADGKNKTVTFREEFENIYGVQFNPENIYKCLELAENAADVKNIMLQFNMLRKGMADANKGDISNRMGQTGQSSLINTFKVLCSNNSGHIDVNKVNEILARIEQENSDSTALKYGTNMRLEKDKNGKWAFLITTANGERNPISTEHVRLINDTISHKLNLLQAVLLDVENVNENTPDTVLLEAINKKTAEYKKTYQDFYAQTYGDKSVEEMSEAYVRSQTKAHVAQTYVDVASMATVLMGSGILVKTAQGLTKGVTVGSRAAVLSQKLVKGAEITTNVAKKATPILLLNQVVRPVKLANNIVSDDADWKEYFKEAGISVTYMLLGMMSGKVGDLARTALKQKGLADVAKNTGKTLEELVALYKSGKTVPPALAQSFKQMEIIATASGSTLEFVADIMLTYAGNKLMLGEDLRAADFIMSLNGVFLGAMMQKEMLVKSRATRRAEVEKSLIEVQPDLKTRPDELNIKIETILDLQDLTAKKQNLSTAKADKAEIEPVDETKTYNANAEVCKENIEKAETREDFAVIREKIKVGKKVDAAANRVLDINDPMYGDIPRISEYLHTKMEAQMGVIKPEEISAWADNISKKYNISKQEVLNIMSRLTQFGNYQSLIKLGDRLADLNIGSFYKDSGISANLAFKYLCDSKQQFKISGEKQAFILDEAGLKYIEKLTGKELDTFKQRIKNGDIVLINIDGTGLKIGDDYYSYTMLDGDQNLEAMTEAVINQMKEGKELNDVLNSAYKNKIQEILGKEIASKIENISLYSTENIDENSIASQLKPNMPDAKIIQATIEEYAESCNISGDDLTKYKALIAKYVDHTIKGCSNDSLMKSLKEMHIQIEKRVAELGKTSDDVIYVYPRSDKSYVMVQYMYAKANNIPFDKFLKYDGMTTLPPGKVIVILDDVSSSGISMAEPYADEEGVLGFSYRNAHINNPNSNIIFAPLFCADDGYKFIKGKIKEFGSTNKDFLIEASRTNVDSFLSKLSVEEQQFLFKHFGYLGFEGNMLCISFPYMIPDNCCSFSGLLLDFCLNYTAEDDANKAAMVVDKYKPRIIERSKK